jgi:glucose-1-phosphate adenylyltransferase
MKKILAMIMAGGKGERLYPLTRDRAKPAVPFGGTHRIIDFTISNCVNSDIRKIYILAQYKSLSLDRHIQRAWNFLSSRVGEFVYIIHAQQRINENWYKGTADAIYQNFYTLQQERPDMVIVLSGDHVYKMDYRPMIEAHLKKKADLTIATYEVPASQSRHFGVLQIDKNRRIRGFQEKPARPKTIPGNPDGILANMGIYIFNTDVLVKRLIENARKADTEHDFGKNIIPSMLKHDRVFAYSHVDGDTGKPAYWKDVGTIEAYFEANFDLLKEEPGIDLYDKAWPIYTFEKQAPPARITGFEECDGRRYGMASDSMISKGCRIHGAHINNAILSPNVNVGRHSIVQDSVVLDNVSIGRNCVIKNAVIDKDTVIPDGTEIGCNPKRDARAFTVTDSGIVVIARGSTL